MYGQKLANYKVLRQVKSFVKFLFEFRFLNYGFSLYPSESMACAKWSPNSAYNVRVLSCDFYSALVYKNIAVQQEK